MNRERARIRTFPDWYEFSGTKESIRKQIGGAILPDGTKVIIQSILSTIYDIKYPASLANIDVNKILEDNAQLNFCA